MSTTTVIVVATVVFGWSIVAERLAARNLTGPLVFLLAGLLLANSSWGIVAPASRDPLACGGTRIDPPRSARGVQTPPLRRVPTRPLELGHPTIVRSSWPWGPTRR